MLLGFTSSLVLVECAWAHFPAPVRGWSFASLVEARNGFPFSVATDSGATVGAVNSHRYPAYFDLGERAKVVIISVTEGADKPLKYPQMFRAGELMLVNKIDLLPYVTFDVTQCASYARQVNPGLEILEVSATRGDGLDRWYDWLRHKARPQPASSA